MLRRDQLDTGLLLREESRALAEARKDAERYRWLREAKRFGPYEDFYADVDRWSVSVERCGTGRVLWEASLDAAIDAAIEAENGK